MKKYSVPDSERQHFANSGMKPNSHVGKQVPRVFEKIPKPEEIPKPPMLNIQRDKKLKDHYGSYL